MSRIIYTGDTHTVNVLIQTNGNPVPIPADADVSAALVDSFGELLSGPWENNEYLGGDWANGIVTVWLKGEDTANLEPGTVRIEIQISADGQTITRQTSETLLLRRGVITPP